MPIIVPPPTPPPTRRSLANCRRVLAGHPALNSLTLVTTDGTAPDASSIVSSQLALAMSDANRYRNQWLYVYNGGNAGAIRRIGELALATSTGQLKAGPVPFTTAMPSGVTVEIHKRLPPVALDGMTGLRACLNYALRELWVIDRVTLAAAANTPSYDLSTITAGLTDWLDPDAITEVYGPRLASALNLTPWGGWETGQVATATPTVQLRVSPGLGAGDTVTVEITRPGNTYMRVGNVWQDNQDGFVNDSDECMFRPEILAEVALVYAFGALAESSEGSEQARWQQKADMQRRKVNVWKRESLPHPSRRTGNSVFRGIGYDAKDFSTW